MKCRISYNERLNVDPDQTATEHRTINIDFNFFVKKHTNTLALTPSW